MAKSIKNADDLQKLGLWLLLPFAGVVSHSWIPFPPTLLLFFLSLLCALLLYDPLVGPTHLQRNISWRKSEKDLFFWCFLFCLYIFSSQYLIDAPFRRYIGVVISPLYLVLCMLYAKDMDASFFRRMVRLFIRISVAFFCLEALLRYGVSIYKILEETNYYYGIYRFKFYSPVYTDSNPVGIVLIILLFFTFWWGRVEQKVYGLEKGILLLLIALSLSRSCIPALFLGFIFFYFFSHYPWKKVLWICILLLSLVVGSVFALRPFILDSSLASKFTIFYDALHYFQNASLWNILFGIGFENSCYILSFCAHNYFLTFLIESGIVGLSLLCLFLGKILQHTHGRAMIVLLPFLGVTLTYAINFLPFLFVIFGVMMVYTPDKEKAITASSTPRHFLF